MPSSFRLKCSSCPAWRAPSSPKPWAPAGHPFRAVVGVRSEAQREAVVLQGARWRGGGWRRWRSEGSSRRRAVRSALVAKGPAPCSGRMSASWPSSLASLTASAASTLACVARGSKAVAASAAVSTCRPLRPGRRPGPLAARRLGARWRSSCPRRAAWFWKRARC